MIRPIVVCALLAAATIFGPTGCMRAGAPKALAPLNLGAEVVRGGKPALPAAACWATDNTPAVIETVTDQIPQAASPDQDAGYRIETSQNIVRPREQFWFRTPCAEALTPDVIATLQRALAARGFFNAEATGVFDQATRAAIRGYQTSFGLKSDRLSLAAARELGVVAADFANTDGT